MRCLRASAKEALAQLLQGTGLKFEYLTPRSIRILAAVVGPPRETTPKTPRGDELQEVIVTANRREENLQDVPMTIQVLTGATLARLNATTFDDFVSYLPGVTAHGVGPGQNNIYVRGLGTADSGIQGSGSTVLFRTSRCTSMSNPRSCQAAISTSMPRISSASRYWRVRRARCSGRAPQAGVVRYITNKPKLNVTEAMRERGLRNDRAR